MKEQIGCYIDESAGSADDCNLRTIELAGEYGFESGPLPEEDNEDYSQILSERADEAVDYLNDQNETPHTYWTFEDNSLFLAPDIDGAKEDSDGQDEEIWAAV